MRLYEYLNTTKYERMQIFCVFCNVKYSKIVNKNKSMRIFSNKQGNELKILIENLFLTDYYWHRFFVCQLSVSSVIWDENQTSVKNFTFNVIFECKYVCVCVYSLNHSREETTKKSFNWKVKIFKAPAAVWHVNFYFVVNYLCTAHTYTCSTNIFRVKCLPSSSSLK